MAELESIVTSIITLASGLAGVVCALFLVVAGYQYMTSTGNPEALERSKAAALNAIVGLGLVLSARVLATVVRTALTTGG